MGWRNPCEQAASRGQGWNSGAHSFIDSDACDLLRRNQPPSANLLLAVFNHAHAGLVSHGARSFDYGDSNLLQLPHVCRYRADIENLPAAGFSRTLVMRKTRES